MSDSDGSEYSDEEYSDEVREQLGLQVKYIQRPSSETAMLGCRPAI